MQQLVDDLLTFSRVGSQGRALEPVDAAAVTRRVIRSLQATIAETGAEVECGDLPTVLADEIQLGQVLQNLLSNALKFHAEDRAPHVRIDAVAEDGQWVFSVADNGIGIEEQYAQRIFQMFQRLHGRREYEGSGIGLTIAKKIVERHGGAIWFTSVPGRGTTFCFSLRAAADGRRPLARASADAGAPG
jgi:light-regulated signal transduction histidine kinase (bacteriophytochrome)